MVYTEFANYWYYFSITTCISHQPWEVGRGTWYLCNKTSARFYLCWAKGTFIRRCRPSSLVTDSVRLETTRWSPKTIWNKGGCQFFWLFLFPCLNSPFWYCSSVLNVRQCMKGTHCSDDTAAFSLPWWPRTKCPETIVATISICNFKNGVSCNTNVLGCT